jgi:hypothetical protein
VAQFTQQKNLPLASTPWPMMTHEQCSQRGATMWMAHSKLSNVCVAPLIVTLNALS